VNIHSRLLIHWTGKYLENKITEQEDENKQIRESAISFETQEQKDDAYFELLKNDLLEGLFFKITKEDSIRKVYVDNILRICFAEIKLSQVQEQAWRFGKLGIGFSQDFVLKRGGRPVIYIPYDDKNNICIMEESIRKIYMKNKDFDLGLIRPITNILSFVKRMSELAHESSEMRNIYFYDEMEWRIVFDKDINGAYFAQDQKIKNGFRLKISPGDVKIIVLPNEEVKQKFYLDHDLSNYFSGTSKPEIVTLDDCKNF
jgi:hypothetical protein